MTVPDTNLIAIALAAVILPMAVAGLSREARSRTCGCVVCGYSMRGLRSDRCPECGVLRNRRAERIGGRRWWLIAGWIGVIMLDWFMGFGLLMVMANGLVPSWRTTKYHAMLQCIGSDTRFEVEAVSWRWEHASRFEQFASQPEPVRLRLAAVASPTSDLRFQRDAPGEPWRPVGARQTEAAEARLANWLKGHAHDLSDCQKESVLDLMKTTLRLTWVDSAVQKFLLSGSAPGSSGHCPQCYGTGVGSDGEDLTGPWVRCISIVLVLASTLVGGALAAWWAWRQPSASYGMR